jgi:hypothetical protein
MSADRELKSFLVIYLKAKKHHEPLSVVYGCSRTLRMPLGHCLEPLLALVVCVCCVT